jgi:hypothetical protein
VLDMTVLARVKMVTEPFTWGRCNRVIEPAIARELECAFPTTGFSLNARDIGSDKTYRFAIRHALAPGRIELACDDLALSWRRLLASIVRPEYRFAMGELTGLDLRSAILEIMFNVYSSNDWLSPHTDKAPKLVTQIFYFSGDWSPDWGGQLLLLGDPLGAVVVDQVLPKTGESVVLVRSDRSWHAVQPVREVPGAKRRTLQVNFWGEMPLHSAAGRYSRSNER